MYFYSQIDSTIHKLPSRFMRRLLSRLMSCGVDSKMLMAQIWLWSLGLNFGGVVDSWSPELCNREKLRIGFFAI